MYFIDDKPSAIRQIQKFLGINESGIFDENTRAAVLDFQVKNKIEATGIVDYETFVKLTEEYSSNEIKRKVNLILPFDNAFPYKRGDRGESMSILNSMLSLSIDKYGLNLIKPRGDYYSLRTEYAVNALRKIFLLEDERIIDEIFYERLQRQSK